MSRNLRGYDKIRVALEKVSCGRLYCNQYFEINALCQFTILDLGT